MDGGGEKGTYFIECNKDHLATAKNSSMERQKNNTEWLACGFNGFRQLNFENKRKLLQFEGHWIYVNYFFFLIIKKIPFIFRN